MRRTFLVGLIAVLAAGSVDVGACGDKFLRMGRSARFKRYAAVYPANILIYRPAKATPAGIKELESILTHAGHKAVVVDRGANIASVLASADYDLLLVDYGDAGVIRSQVQAVASRPDLLPILGKSAKSVEDQARREYVCLLRPQAMTKYDALAEIDRLMELRRKGSAAPPSR